MAVILSEVSVEAYTMEVAILPVKARIVISAYTGSFAIKKLRPDGAP
jgi:hypothetical protein